MRGRSERLTLLLLSLLFAGVVYQWPLFSENQNVYFLPGLANAGLGGLSADWRAQQLDITPLFSLFVSAVHLYGAPWMYYAVQGLLLCVYAGSLYAIVSALSARAGARLSPTVVLALLAVVHSAWVLNIVGHAGTPLAPVVLVLQKLAQASITGVAGQEIPGPLLQPSAVGVLLLTSLAVFLRGREYLATVIVVLAASVHSSLILQAGFLVLAYIVVLWCERRQDVSWRVAGIAAVGLLPIVTYIGYWLVVVDPPDVHAFAQAINAQVRQPHHTQPALWFTRWSVVQLGILGCGFWWARAYPRLCLVMATCAGLAVSLTLLQMATGSNSLAIMFPWRASVWLVPTATMIVLGQVALWLQRRVRPWITVACGGILVVACLIGVWKTLSLAQLRATRDHGTMIEFVQQRANRSQTYLVPTDFAHFRLATGAPIFVDWKGFPYGSAEIVEWDRRVRLVKAFYAASTPEAALDAFHAITARSPITHVVAERAHDPLRDLAIARMVYSDHVYVVYEIQP